MTVKLAATSVRARLGQGQRDGTVPAPIEAPGWRVTERLAEAGR